tara:strand:+ start:335 stop:1000 length:666 start_codon:yes stop_codon:yes gene_type:complete
MAKDDQIPNLHFSEDAETEKIKDWWKKNGISIIVGLVIGIGAVASYQGWNFYQNRQSEIASDLYQSMLRSFDAGSIDAARMEADQIISNFGSTTYADGASLMLAKFDFEIGNLDKARIHLNRVMEKSNDSGLRHIARLRQATIAISDEDLDFADELLEISEIVGFESRYHELRGDVWVMRNEDEKANREYNLALEYEAAGSIMSQILERKLNDVSSFKDDK